MQGLFPVILGHEGGGIVSFVVKVHLNCLTDANSGRIGWGRCYRCCSCKPGLHGFAFIYHGSSRATMSFRYTRPVSLTAMSHLDNTHGPTECRECKFCTSGKTNLCSKGWVKLCG